MYTNLTHEIVILEYHKEKTRRYFSFISWLVTENHLEEKKCTERLRNNKVTVSRDKRGKSAMDHKIAPPSRHLPFITQYLQNIKIMKTDHGSSTECFDGKTI